MYSTVNMSEMQHALKPCVAANTRQGAMTDEHPRGCDAWRHSEPGVCAAARKLGFRSVLMDIPGGPPWAHIGAKRRGAGPRGVSKLRQLVLCNDWCMKHVSCDECPPVMQNRTGQCACNRSVGVSNC